MDRVLRKVEALPDAQAAPLIAPHAEPGAAVADDEVD
jgi:hypothetical protein